MTKKADNPPDTDADLDDLDIVPESVKALNHKQQAAIAYLARGQKQAEVARQVGVSRQSINTWLHNDDRFRAALKDIQESLYFDSPVAEVKLFEQIERIPPLTTVGVRKRIELIDRLILTDLRNSEDKREGMIHQLQNAVAKANDFVEKLSADEVAADLFRDQSERFRTAVLRATVSILADVPDADDRLSRLRTKLNAIDRESGVLE